MLTKKSGVVMVAPTDTLAHALGLMTEAGIGAILVAENKMPVGILTERDVLKHWRSLTDAAFLAKPVGALASQPVFTLTVDDLNQVATAMVDRRIRHVPLVDAKGAVIGIVSMRDLVEAQVRAKSVPRLIPIVAKQPQGSEPPPPKTLHILTPTAELAELCQQFLPPHWRCQIWMNIRSIENLPALKAEASGRDVAFMLDLDGIAHGDWKGLIRKFVKLLSRADRPVIYLTWSPHQFSEKDIHSLVEVAKKAKWFAFQRPLPIPELAHDLAGIDDAVKAAEIAE